MGIALRDALKLLLFVFTVWVILAAAAVYKSRQR